MLQEILRKFRAAEDGAVTVDFVVLTAAVCLTGLTAVSAFDGAVIDLANEIELSMDSVQLP